MTNPDLLGLDTPCVWDMRRAFHHLHQIAQADTERTAGRRLHEIGFLPIELKPDQLIDSLGRRPTLQALNAAIEQARQQHNLVLFAQLHPLPGGHDCLHANDDQGSRYWVPLEQTPADPAVIADALRQLQNHIGKSIAVFPHRHLIDLLRQLPSLPQVHIRLLGYPPMLELDQQKGQVATHSRHLKNLEAESIHIIREAVAEAEHPVMLYSVGKDSSVMLHLARKAFFPAPPPFPLLHVDTRWKFQEMYLFRDHMAQASGMELLVHINPEAIARNINPFDHGSALHTHITKTEGLKQALDKHGFDVIFGGARRDEEKARAKERIFSFRTPTHHWDPKHQRPELWTLYNTRKRQGESVRVFPLSNWTELDIWKYIYQEQIAVVPLYFAKERPVVIRDNMILMVDDNRFRLRPGEEIQARQIRFRTLGCYPLTGAIESSASNVADIILELINTRYSERQGRIIDADGAASMEKKKQEGYF